jgi:hypothetical protein
MSAELSPPPFTTERRALSTLIGFARNSRTHSPEQIAQLAASIREWGFTIPILIDEHDTILAGHGRLAAAQKLALADVPVIVARGWSDAQKHAYVIADNKLAMNAGWDFGMLATELKDLALGGFDLINVGFEESELAGLLGDMSNGGAEGTEQTSPANGSLAERFLIPPFSVFNAREGWWQDRKRDWIALGIRSELGRGENTLGFSEVCNTGGYVAQAKREAESYAKAFGNASQVQAQHRAIPGGDTGPNSKWQGGTSIFDPVLCEIAYRWFTPKGGTILDPFAGGSVRGIVAAKLGRQYIGNELSEQQVLANRAQATTVCANDPLSPVWNCGDSRNIETLCFGVEADFIFSCPPYADLEVYSDDKKDLSTLAYPEFRAAYREIIAASCRMLKPDRFACFVVGEVRGDDGAYYNFVGDTVQAFIDAGLKLYNEAILLTAIGSLPIRVGRQFSVSRKLGKTHQNVLVFIKGDPKVATAACGDVEVTVPEEAPEPDAPSAASGDPAAQYGEVL